MTESAPDGRAPRVLIADDEELIRTGFRLILASRGIDVIGEAADGVQAVAEAERLCPDVLLMDIRMPHLDGLEAARRVLRLLPHCRVIMLTTFDLDRYVYAALAAGASGFLLKDVTAAHLAAAVRLVNTGDALLAPRSPAVWSSAMRPPAMARRPARLTAPPLRRRPARSRSTATWLH